MAAVDTLPECPVQSQPSLRRGRPRKVKTEKPSQTDLVELAEQKKQVVIKKVENVLKQLPAVVVDEANDENVFVSLMKGKSLSKSPNNQTVPELENSSSASKKASSSKKATNKTSVTNKSVTKKRAPKKPANHLITEYFSVITRKRKTSKDLKEEEDRNIIYHLENDIDPITFLSIHEIENKGRGIVAIKPIPKGAFICEYRGELIQMSDAKVREEKYERQNRGCYMYYFTWNNRQWCIDATEDTGRYGRLINHSRKSPNCKSRLFILNDTPHLIFFALNDIQPGTELLYDYGDTRRVALESHPWLKES